MTTKKSKTITILKPKTIILGFISLVSLLSIANIVASNAVSTTGGDLENLTTKVTALREENLKLSKTLAEKSSLNIIAEKAEEQGFTPIEKTLSLAEPEPLAQASQN